MNSINIAPEIPQQIVEGLENGIYERIGGAIREVDSRHIIAWLREAYDLSEPVVSELLSLSSTPANVNALNFALTTMEFAVIMKRLDIIEKQLKQVQMVLDSIDHKIDLSFYANFRAALDLATNAFTMDNAETRRACALQAINRFLEAEHHYTDLADLEISSKSQIADDYLFTLSLAYVTEVRCYLELDEFETAIQRLNEGLKILKPRFEKHTKTLLTSNPSAYLHPSLKSQVGLKRLTNVYRWLTPGVDETAVFEAQRDNLFNLAQSPQDWIDSLPPAVRQPVKSHFFNPKLIAEFAEQFSKKGWVNRFKSLKVINTEQHSLKEMLQDPEDEPFARLPEMMQLMESMIETCSRFEIYLTELQVVQESGINFQEWKSLSYSGKQSHEAKLLYITFSPN